MYNKNCNYLIYLMIENKKCYFNNYITVYETGYRISI